MANAGLFLHWRLNSFGGGLGVAMLGCVRQLE